MNSNDLEQLKHSMVQCGYKQLNKTSIIDFYEKCAGRCERCTASCRPVLAEGPWDAKVLIISNKTSKSEDMTNTIFPKGTLEGSQLNKYLEPLGLIRQDCKLCNAIQGYCVGGYEPSACLFWSRLLISVLQPKLIIMLGLETAKRFDLEKRLELNSLNYYRSGHIPTLILAHPSLNNLREEQHVQALDFLQKLDKNMLGDYL